MCKRTPTAAVLLALLFLTFPLLAQQGVPVDQVHDGSALVALSQVAVRDRPPNGGAVYSLGQQTGLLKPGETIAVTGEQTVSTILGNQKWVCFSLSGSSRGWVLVGNTGSTSPYFGAK